MVIDNRERLHAPWGFIRAPFLLLLLLSVTNFCCKNSDVKLQDYIAASSSDTLSIEIPRGFDGHKSNKFRFVKHMSSKLDIEQVDSGYTPLQIRIWYHYGLVDTSQLFLLKKVDEKWIALWYTIAFHAGLSHADTSISMIKDINPRDGWHSFLNHLFELKIDQLPDMDSLPGSSNFVMTEPTGVLVEFATINKYRLYSYVYPAAFKDKWWQAKNMEDILTYVEIQFGFKRLKPF